MENICVSIIVPIYNKEKYLEKCLDSIVGQTLKEIEIILIDDGSTDSGKELCERYTADSRVSYYYQENEGLASARQSGIDRAVGEYIGFIDADDWIEPEMFEKMYSAAKQYDADVVFCNRKYNDDDYLPSKEIPTGYYDRERILSDVLPRTLAYIDEKGGKRSISWSNTRRIFRSSFLSRIGFRFDKRFRRSQDLQLTYEAMLSANAFYHLGDDYFVHARTVPDSLARGYTKNMWSLYIPLIERLYRDTEAFTELDLMPQMHLRNFFFVTDCINNELKPSFPYDEKKRVELIDEIVRHPLCERYYGHIRIEKMSPFYQKYYELIRQKDAEGIVSFTRAYRGRQRLRKKYFVPFAHFVTEGPLIGTIYKKLFYKR